MSAPRLEVRLDLLGANARALVGRLGARGISITAVTKATLGSPEVAHALLAAGVAGLGESRIENVERLRAGGVTAPITLIRSPMMSQADRVVAAADLSCNTELAVVERLAEAALAQRRRHGVVLMVELGDLREGILPADIEAAARATMALPGVVLRGIGTNLACQSGVVPDQDKMGELSAIAARLAGVTGRRLEIVSGGNSANVDWACDPRSDIGGITDLRLGEAILLGREPLHRRPIDGLSTDAIALVAEVIEAKVKPTLPWGELGETAFGAMDRAVDQGDRNRVIVAIGRQDTDPDGLGAPTGLRVLGASSDHLLLDTGALRPEVGSEIRFAVNYSALVRSMTSPFVKRTLLRSADLNSAPALI